MLESLYELISDGFLLLERVSRVCAVLLISASLCRIAYAVEDCVIRLGEVIDELRLIGIEARARHRSRRD